MKYENEVKFLWENYVPNQGKSNILQGELVRIIEQLRYEAIYNLNSNWDTSWISSIHFLMDYLPSEEKVLHNLLEKGNYARKYYDGDAVLDVDKMAVLDDEVYDSLLDAVIENYYLGKDLEKIS